MEKKEPFISVVMPVYNVEKHLRKAVESVLKQSYQNFEIILVDDCSPDGCPELCEQIAKEDSRVKVLHHEKNQGLSMARNTGMEEASGTYIWFMDSDDYVEDNLFAMVKESLLENPAEVVIFGLTEDYYDDHNKLHHSEVICPKMQYFKSEQELRKKVIDLEKQTLYGYAWNKIYDLSYLKNIKLQFEKITLIEDILFNVNFFMHIQKMNLISFSGYHYNKRMDNSLTSKFVPEYYKLHRKRIELIYKQYQNWKMCDENVKSILGALYVRYIFSALQRNCDTRSQMSHMERKKWTKILLQEPLVRELLPYANSDGKLLQVMIKVLRTDNVSAVLFLGRVIFICKNLLPMIFSVLKQKR